METIINILTIPIVLMNTFAIGYLIVWIIDGLIHDNKDNCWLKQDRNK